MRAFWLMTANVRRLQAENDLRALTVANAAASGESAQQVRTHLLEEMGEVAREDPRNARIDLEGFQELKRWQR